MRETDKTLRNARRKIWLVSIAALLTFALAPASAAAAGQLAADPPTGCITGTYSSGMYQPLYMICVPPNWNGQLVVYAHGYVNPADPLAIVDNTVDGTPVSQILMSLGYAFAT